MPPSISISCDYSYDIALVPEVSNFQLDEITIQLFYSIDIWSLKITLTNGCMPSAWNYITLTYIICLIVVFPVDALENARNAVLKY
jgi:hypothetical protein